MTARILVIEDEPALRGMLKALLELRGHEVVLAADGREGVALIETQRFDLAISDVIMPNQDGVETLLIVRERFPQLPIIVMTGGNELDAEYYLRIVKMLGAGRTLKKPFNVEALHRCVDELLQLRPSS